MLQTFLLFFKDVQTKNQLFFALKTNFFITIFLSLNNDVIKRFEVIKSSFIIIKINCSLLFNS